MARAFLKVTHVRDWFPSWVCFCWKVQPIIWQTSFFFTNHVYWVTCPLFGQKLLSHLLFSAVVLFLLDVLFCRNSVNFSFSVVVFITLIIIVISLYYILVVTLVIVIPVVTMQYVQPTTLIPGRVYIRLAWLMHKLTKREAPIRPVPTILPQTNGLQHNRRDWGPTVQKRPLQPYFMFDTNSWVELILENQLARRGCPRFYIYIVKLTLDSCGTLGL